MTQLILMMTCLLAGMVINKKSHTSERPHVGLDLFVVHLSLPCLIIHNLHSVSLSMDLIIAVFMPWILFIVTSIFYFLTFKFCQIPARTVGSLIITSGLANTSIVGLPMIAAFYGSQSLYLGIMIGQFGTYLVLSTLGVVTACLCSGSNASHMTIVSRILKFPPFLAVLVALSLWNVSYPPWIDDLLRQIGETLAPVALFSIGLQLRQPRNVGDWKALAVGLTFKLFLGPAIICFIYICIFHCHPNLTRIIVFESAMGPQIGAAIVGIQYGLDSVLMARMVGIGTVLSFVTIPLWWAALRLI